MVTTNKFQIPHLTQFPFATTDDHLPEGTLVSVLTNKGINKVLNTQYYSVIAKYPDTQTLTSFQSCLDTEME